MNLIQSVVAAHKCGVPLVGIKTPDPADTIREISRALCKDDPQVAWEIIKGYRELNDAGSSVVGITNTCDGNILEAIKKARAVPENTVVFIQMADRFLSMPPVVQAVWNLRDEFKSKGQMLIMLGATMNLPAELTHDVLVLDEPLPDDKQLSEIVKLTAEAAEIELNETLISETVNAITGLTTFEAEQVVAMSISGNKLETGECWERKRKMIDSTKGLSVFRGKDRFDDLAGLGQVKKYLRGLMSGDEKPRAIVWLDEIEKSGLANTGDLSGVNNDQLGVVLSYMEDRKVMGMMLVGTPGSGKSHLCKAMAAEFDRIVIRMDMGAMKGSLVGDSEQNIRAALKIVDAIAGENAMFVATSNSIEGLDTALRSRFTGTFFFDLPTQEQLSQMWDIHMNSFGLKGDLPEHTGWSGRNVQRCCYEAKSHRIPLMEASQYIIPELVSNRDAIEKMRAAAKGKYLSSCFPGAYMGPANETMPNGSRKRVFG